jgi:hypothetical protein
MRIRLASTVLACWLTPAVPAAGFLLAALSSSGAAHASVAREASLRHLVTVADLAVAGISEEATSVWEEIPEGGKRIVTYTRVHVEDRAFGDSSSDVWVRTLGGVVGNIGQHVEGEASLALGQRTVLFLRAREDGTHGVVEMAQGHYVVQEEKAVPRLKASPRMGTLVKATADLVPARAALVGRALPEALTLIKSERKAAGK